MPTLDVGCGSKPKGEVNIHRFLHKTSHRTKTVNPQNVNIPDSTEADAHYLPFGKAIPSLVFCHQLLEHKGARYVVVTNEFLRAFARRVPLFVPCPAPTAEKVELWKPIH